MGVFHVFYIVQMVPNRAKHHILSGSILFYLRDMIQTFCQFYVFIFSVSWRSVDVVRASLLLALTHQTPKLPSYRNELIDLLYKSIEWFLYDGNFGD